MLATCYERIWAATKDLCDTDKQIDIEFDELEVLTEKVTEAQRMADLAMSAVSCTRNTYRTFSVRWRRRLMRWRRT